MPDELILYTNPYTRGRVARWMLEETGAAYQAVAVSMRTLGGVTGLNEVFRFEVVEDKVVKLRLYCFNPDVLAAVAEEPGMPALRRPNRGPG